MTIDGATFRTLSYDVTLTYLGPDGVSHALTQTFVGDRSGYRGAFLIGTHDPKAIASVAVHENTRVTVFTGL